MLKVDLSAEIVNDCLEKSDYVSLTAYLQQFFLLKKNENGTPMFYQYSESIVQVLHNILKRLLSDNIGASTGAVIKELFRCLRNYVVNPDVQDYVEESKSLLCDTELLMLKLMDTPFSNKIPTILHFLINVVISNQCAAHKVYDIFWEDIMSLLKREMFIYEISALMHNLSLYKAITLDREIYSFVLHLYQQHSKIEYLQFFLEKSLSYSQFWQIYDKLNIPHRLEILSLIRQQQTNGLKVNLPQDGVDVLTKTFIKCGDIIFQTSQNNESNLEAYEVSQLLEVISSLASSQDYLNILQKDKNLLIHCAVLLINIHRLGKEANNCFSPIRNLSELRNPNDRISEHPAFGFKGDLIRIIGNLCWQCKVMQDLTREAELIPVVLDCCNMDARNPFIMQWSIFAIRNFCENNLENQALIAGLHKQGEVSSVTLEEMGLTFHSEGDNSLKMVSLDAIRNRK